MKKTCSSHKRLYASPVLAEHALIEAHQRNDYSHGKGPVNFYECTICGYYHLTSKGEILPQLKELFTSGKIQKDRQAHFWEQRLRKK